MEGDFLWALGEATKDILMKSIKNKVEVEDALKKMMQK